MDVEDLREFVGGGGDQDGGLCAAPGECSARRRVARSWLCNPYPDCVAVVVVHRFVHSLPSRVHPLHDVVVEHVTTMSSATARG